MEGDDAIPVIGLHRGVPLEDQQSPERLALVKTEIDHVLGMTDAGERNSRPPWPRLRGR